MSAYVDWTYYSTTYLGTAIAQADFDTLALRASSIIDMLTFNRVAEIFEDDEDAETITKIKFATCAVAEELQNQITTPAGIESERVGNYSVTYAPTSEMQLSNHQKLSVAAKIHLGNTGLMLAGFATGEYGGLASED